MARIRAYSPSGPGIAKNKESNNYERHLQMDDGSSSASSSCLFSNVSVKNYSTLLGQEFKYCL